MPVRGHSGDLSSKPYGSIASPLDAEHLATAPAGPQAASTGDGPVHLLLCANAAFLQHATVCLTSILVNNPELFFDVVIVARPEERLERDKLRRSLARYSNYSVTFREFRPPSDLVLPLNPRVNYTIDIWTRLWVAEFFPEEVDRVLYLDSDIVVVGSIAALWNTDLGGALLGAVDIPGSDRGVGFLGLPPEDGYFNSGVLLINVEQWRQTRALETILAYIQEQARRMVFTPDQDALNACFHDRRKPLDYKWNAVWTFFRAQHPVPLTSEEIASVCNDARIIHFNSTVKPWSYFCDHPRKDEYEKYLRLTEWRDFVPPDRTVVNRLRKSASAILPEKAKALLKEIMPAIGVGR
jgi:lipopolysaccharide biosynthesis glycosyltransferase